MNDLKLSGITCNNLFHKKRGVTPLWCIVLYWPWTTAKALTPSLLRVTVSLWTRETCGQRWLLVTSPQSKGPNKGQHTELVLVALYWLSRSNQLRGGVGCMCVLGGGMRTRGGSNFSCIKTVADSAEFKKGGSKNKWPKKRGKNKQRRKKILPLFLANVTVQTFIGESTTISLDVLHLVFKAPILNPFLLLIDHLWKQKKKKKKC